MKKEVWVVEYVDEDYREGGCLVLENKWVVGIFSTEEKARQCIEDYPTFERWVTEWKVREEPTARTKECSELIITEMELDKVKK